MPHLIKIVTFFKKCESYFEKRWLDRWTGVFKRKLWWCTINEMDIRLCIYILHVSVYTHIISAFLNCKFNNCNYYVKTCLFYKTCIIYNKKIQLHLWIVNFIYLFSNILSCCCFLLATIYSLKVVFMYFNYAITLSGHSKDVYLSNCSGKFEEHAEINTKNKSLTKFIWTTIFFIQWFIFKPDDDEELLLIWDKCDLNGQ